MVRGAPRVFTITALALTLMLARVAAQQRASVTGSADVIHPATADRLGRAAVEKVCGTCHSSDLVLRPRTERQWEESIDAMIQMGASGSDEDLAWLNDYIARKLTRLDVNKANAEALAMVLGVSPEVAQQIVAYRDATGPFRSLADFRKAPGLDAATVDEASNRLDF